MEHVTAWFERGGPELPLTGEDGLATGVTVVLCTYRRPHSVARFLRSLAAQERQPEALVVVDASPDDATERVVDELGPSASAPTRLCYARVAGPLRGLTRQRNFGLHAVTTDVVVFFDDDVVLQPGCLAAMEAAMRRPGIAAAGVGAFVVDPVPPGLGLWRVRRALGIVGTLAPGRYSRSGFSTPWGAPARADAVVEGDWLPGCAMMWRTAIVRALGFHAALDGYAQGEDLEFSLRARRHGPLLMAGGARVLHLHEAAGRPDAFRLGYMAIHNRYQIHRRGLADRRARDVAWFAYAWTLDTLLLARHLPRPAHAPRAAREMAGRVKAAYDLMLAR